MDQGVINTARDVAFDMQQVASDLRAKAAGTDGYSRKVAEKTCQECGRSVQDFRVQCPACGGGPSRRPRRRRSSKRLTAGFGT